MGSWPWKKVSRRPSGKRKRSRMFARHGRARDLLDDPAQQDVVGVRVVEAGVRAAVAGPLERQDLVRAPAVPRPVEDPRLVAGMREVVVDAAAVREEHPDRDALGDGVVGQPRGDGLVQGEAALLLEPEHERRHERLGQRADVEGRQHRDGLRRPCRRRARRRCPSSGCRRAGARRRPRPGHRGRRASGPGGPATWWPGSGRARPASGRRRCHREAPPAGGRPGRHGGCAQVSGRSRPAEHSATAKSALSDHRSPPAPTLCESPDGDGSAAILGPAGEVAEWLKATVLKTVGRKPRGFESHPLRQAWTERETVGPNDTVAAGMAPLPRAGWPSGIRGGRATLSGAGVRPARPRPARRPSPGSRRWG